MIGLLCPNGMILLILWRNYNMKLRKFLSENIIVNGVTYSEREYDSFMTAWEQIKRECKPFLKELSTRNRNKLVLLRGASSNKRWEKRSVRTDRYPKDMESQWHEAFDEVFDTEFDFKARSQGLFCTGKHSVAGGYGDNVYIIFPIGKYKYIWSHSITDLYSEVSDGSGNQYLEPDESTMEEWREDYENQYGEGEEGSWYWDNQGVDLGSDLNDATDTVTGDLIIEIESDIDDLKSDIDDLDTDSETYEDDLESLELQISEKEKEIADLKPGGDRYDEIKDEMTWEPEISYDSFEEDMYANWWDNVPDSMYYDGAEQIIKSGKYQENNLIQALQHQKGTEIMVKCKSYYMINYDYLELFKLVFFEGTDPRQLSFDFMKKK